MGVGHIPCHARQSIYLCIFVIRPNALINKIHHGNYRVLVHDFKSFQSEASKLDVPNSVTYLRRILLLEWYGVRCMETHTYIMNANHTSVDFPKQGDCVET